MRAIFASPSSFRRVLFHTVRSKCSKFHKTVSVRPLSFREVHDLRHFISHMWWCSSPPIRGNLLLRPIITFDKRPTCEWIKKLHPSSLHLLSYTWFVPMNVQLAIELSLSSRQTRILFWGSFLLQRSAEFYISEFSLREELRFIPFFMIINTSYESQN